MRQLANWMSSLQTALDKARTRLSQEKVVLESPLDLEWEDEWVKAYIVLRQAEWDPNIRDPFDP